MSPEIIFRVVVVLMVAKISPKRFCAWVKCGRANGWICLKMSS
jgi:hypothetical protein